MKLRSFVAIIIALMIAQTVEGQQQGPPGTQSDAPINLAHPPFPVEGPPPPQPPEVISRDASGRATLRAVRLTTPIQIDGRLDELVYTNVLSMSGFIQNDPAEGEPATEKTEVWIFFDDDNVYITARCWESRPDRLVASEMRRDNTRIVRDDNFAWMLDTFYDRRNGIIFEVSAIGGRIDAQVTDEQQVNLDWNPVWDVTVAKFEGGWAMEAALPFKSLRYRSGPAQVWGFQARRINRWRNESSYLTPLSAAQTNRGHWRASLAATLVGLEAPQGLRNLEIKPYVISDLVSDVHAMPQVSNNVSAEIGVDVKYGITENLTTDFTYNSDFAQVEADEQQVNLTRFSLFFPEKREFFLENQGTFAFGGVATSGRQAGLTDAPVLFYSRRIGLNGGRMVPIRAGGRLTGRVGGFSLGLLNIQSDEEEVSSTPATNFSVLRVKRDFLRRSSVGLMLTGRSVRQQGIGTNEAYGVDGTFGFFDDLTINTHWARTHTDDRRGDDISYRAQLNYAGDRYGAQLEHLLVGENFSPEIGFVRRKDMRRSFGELRFSPRPLSIESIRRFSWTGSLAYIENGSGQVETRDWDGEFAIEFENSDRLSLGHSGTYEFLPWAFPIADGVVLPVGGYDFGTTRVGFDFGPQRWVSSNLLVEHGTFFSGYKTSIAFGQGRVNATPHVSIEPTYSVNWVNLEEGSFTTNLLGTRTTYTVTPLMFASTFLQYNSSIDTVSISFRFRWEYQAGSELFVVFNEERDTRVGTFPALANRAVIVKINRLFRF